MAQLTKGLVLEFMSHNNAGRSAPYTAWEFHQLCADWLGNRGHEIPRFTAHPSTAETPAEPRSCNECGGGRGEHATNCVNYKNGY